MNYYATVDRDTCLQKIVYIGTTHVRYSQAVRYVVIIGIWLRLKDFRFPFFIPMEIVTVM
jgi:hypothetical protein